MFDIILPIAGVLVNVAVIAGIGLLIGIISGLFGVGGGFLMTPLLIFLGVPPTIAVATGSAQLVASASFGTTTAWRADLIDKTLTIYLLIGAMTGTVLGIGIFNLLNKVEQFDLVVGWSYVILLGSIGALMLIESIKSFRTALQNDIDEKPATNRLHQWLSRLGSQRYFHKFDVSISLPPSPSLYLYWFDRFGLGCRRRFYVCAGFDLFFPITDSRRRGRVSSSNLFHDDHRNNSSRNL